MKTNSELQQEMIQEYEYSKPFVFLVIIGAILAFIFACFCATAGVYSILKLIFPNFF
jgi:hypothetical protein